MRRNTRFVTLMAMSRFSWQVHQMHLCREVCQWVRNSESGVGTLGSSAMVLILVILKYIFMMLL